MEGNKGTKEWMRGAEVEEMGRRRYWRGGRSRKEIYPYCLLILFRPSVITAVLAYCFVRLGNIVAREKGWNDICNIYIKSCL